MKKKKMIVSALALAVALGGAYAFKTASLPGNLYYFNDLGDCVASPCETAPNSGEPCREAPLYLSRTCTNEYTGAAWYTICY
jgi:hypothetical protein